MEPQLGTFEPVYIGSEHENPVLLSPHEWADVFLDQGLQIRRGERKNGMWHVMVERDGEYEFELRRWAREAAAGMRAPLPPYTGTVGQYPAGIALPIARAGLRVGEIRKTAAVGPEDREVVFRLPCARAEPQFRPGFTTNRARRSAARLRIRRAQELNGAGLVHHCGVHQIHGAQVSGFGGFDVVEGAFRHLVVASAVLLPM